MRLLTAFELMSVYKKIVKSEKQLDLATMVVHNTNTCDYSRAHWNLVLLDDVLVKVNELLNLISERSLHEWLDVP